MEKSKVWDSIKNFLRNETSLKGEIDTVTAEEKIRNNIWFRGANVWILVCSVIIASVGLDVNSTAVIIGAMLISPLMGPIMGMGLSLGINDVDLLNRSLQNYVVMVGVSLFVSFLYFLVSPLNLIDPTELTARTRPTIYDVFIAFFGGVAGILEQSRKEKGTVLSGVAIATALMPPLCTAGYGLANARWSFFFGSMYLFIINTVFILLASYLVSLYLPFNREETSKMSAQKRNLYKWSPFILIAILVPSVISAVGLIRSNNFEREVRDFVTENKTFGGSYIYDYEIQKGSSKKNRKVTVFFTGNEFSDEEMASLIASAKYHGIDEDKIKIEVNRNRYNDNIHEMMREIYERTDFELAYKDMEIDKLKQELTAVKTDEIPYSQVTREIKYKYPYVSNVTISRGVNVGADNLEVTPCISVITLSDHKLNDSVIAELTSWLKIRLNDSTVVVHSFTESENKLINNYDN